MEKQDALQGENGTRNMKFGFYVFGNATRLEKYLSLHTDHISAECVVHDGEMAEILGIFWRIKTFPILYRAG